VTNGLVLAKFPLAQASNFATAQRSPFKKFQLPSRGVTWGARGHNSLGAEWQRGR